MASYIFLQHNLGGLLEKVRGEKSYGYDYITKIGYDKFEQRTYLKYCNGAETFYSYDPQHRRLENLVVNAKAGTIMDNAYSYDAVSNVLSVKNNAPLPQSGKAGGQMSHSYTYDPLYRLSSATNSIGGYPRFYSKCQRAIDPLDSSLTPIARKKTFRTLLGISPFSLGCLLKKRRTDTYLHVCASYCCGVSREL